MSAEPDGDDESYNTTTMQVLSSQKISRKNPELKINPYRVTVVTLRVLGSLALSFSPLYFFEIEALTAGHFIVSYLGVTAASTVISLLISFEGLPPITTTLFIASKFIELWRILESKADMTTKENKKD